MAPSSPQEQAPQSQLEFHQLELTYQSLRIRDARHQARLLASICEHGQQSPVLVVEQQGHRGRYVLIDGYFRVAALQKLGRDTVEAVVLPLDEAAALCLVHRQQRVHRRSALEDGWLLRELVERFELTQVQVAPLLGHSVSWVSRRLAMVRELPDSVQDLVRKGQLCPHGAMRHLVPLARAKPADCQRLVQGIGKTKLSARELGRLYLGWRSSRADERERILQQPLLYLKAEAAARSPPPAPLPGQEHLLREDLETLRLACRRANRRLLAAGALAPQLPLVIDEVWKQSQQAFEKLQTLMEERRHAGS